MKFTKSQMLKKLCIICRFGKGYTLTIRCVPNFSEILLKRISNDLPMATVEDQHCSQLKFNIPQESAHLNEIFSTLSGYKNESIIEDYSVSQTTLDDVSYISILSLYLRSDLRSNFHLYILLFLLSFRYSSDLLVTRKTL